jgi:hypothetical protein
VTISTSGCILGYAYSRVSVSFNTQCLTPFVPSPGKRGHAGTSGVAWGMTLSNADHVGASSCAKGSKDTTEAWSTGGTAAFRNARHRRAPRWQAPIPRCHILRYLNRRRESLRVARRAMETPTGGGSQRTGEEWHIVVSEENGLTFKSTASIGTDQGRIFPTATATIVIERVNTPDSFTLIDVKLMGAESES